MCAAESPNNEEANKFLYSIPKPRDSSFYRVSPTSFYKKRQERFTIPKSILNKLETYDISVQHYDEDIVKILNQCNHIKALCLNDNGKTKSIKNLELRMNQIIEFCDKNVDILWQKCDEDQVKHHINNLSKSLWNVKKLLEKALNVNFRRGARFNNPIQNEYVDIGNKLSALELGLSGEDSTDFAVSNANFKLTKAHRGEIHCLLGHRAYFGHGMKQCYQKAFESYQKAAELGNSDGMNHLAVMYQTGIGVIKNIDVAIEYFQKAIDNENIDAMYNLGSFLLDDKVLKNIPKAFQLLQQASEKGHLSAQTLLAGLYEKGINDYLEPNLNLAMKWYRKASDENHFEAQNNLAVVLLDNFDNGSHEYQQALTLLNKASNGGYAAAQNNLGHCYEFGKAVEKNEIIAMEWYEKSTMQRYAPAFINLGFLELKKKQYEKAFHHFLEASKENTAESWYYLGLMHENGLYVPCNPELAVKYYAKAAEINHEPSMLKLGDSYFSGCGSDTNYTKAYEIYKTLALEGNTTACNNLGIMYEEGLGVTADMENADMWYKMAEEKGNEEALMNSKRLNQLLGKRNL